MAKKKAQTDRSMSLVNTKKKQRWMSTYGMMTAENMMKRYDIAFSPKDMIAQACDPGSFYHWMLKLPVLNAYNDIVRNQVRTRQATAQKLMIDYIYSDKLPKSEESDTGLAIRQNIENKREALIEAGHELTALEERHWISFQAVDSLVLAKLAEWRALTDEKVREVCQILKQDGIDLPDDFPERLRERLEKRAVGIELSEEQLKHFKLKEQPAPLMRAVLSLLSEAE